MEIDQVIDFFRASRDRRGWSAGMSATGSSGETHDLDMIVSRGRASGGSRRGGWPGWRFFVLDEERDVGRAIIRGADGAIEVDVARPARADLLDDLRLRDFTVNAMAMSVDGDLLTLACSIRSTAGPTSNGNSCASSPRAHSTTTRCGCCEGCGSRGRAGVSHRTATFNLMRRDASLLSTVSAERIYAELDRIVTLPGGWQHLRLLVQAELLGHVLPEGHGRWAWSNRRRTIRTSSTIHAACWRISKASTPSCGPTAPTGGLSR